MNPLAIAAWVLIRIHFSSNRKVSSNPQVDVGQVNPAYNQGWHGADPGGGGGGVDSQPPGPPTWYPNPRSATGMVGGIYICGRD